MLQYYERRQPEYEAIYAKAERQDDLKWLEAKITDLVKDRNVLELACGTGYWTRRIVPVAASVEGSSTPISRRDNNGNSFQVRTLADGSEHGVLKNFPSATELRTVMSEYCDHVQIQESEYFWLASGELYE